MSNRGTAELVNQFNSLVAPKNILSSKFGGPPITDPGSPDDEEDEDDSPLGAFPSGPMPTALRDLINKGRASSGLEPTGESSNSSIREFSAASSFSVVPISSNIVSTVTSSELTDSLNEMESLLQTLEQKSNQSGGVVNDSTVAINFGLNTLGQSTLAAAMGDIPRTDLNTTDPAEGYYTILADTDPFFIVEGSFTNKSDQTMSVFIPIEEAIFEPISVDRELSRQFFIDVTAVDTSGDGEAFIQEGQVQFSLFATEDINSPSLANTQSIGFSEALGVSRIDEQRSKRRVGTEGLVDTTFIDRVSEDAHFSHIIGEVRLSNISAGDTAKFRAIVSIGEIGNPSLPLLPVEQLEAILVASEFIAANAVPEPSSALLIAASCMLALVGRRSA